MITFKPFNHFKTPLNIRMVIKFILITAILFFSLKIKIHAGENGLPFYPGEHLTFKLKWTIIPAGDGVLEVLPPEFINGVKAYHFVLKVNSNAFVDHFYKVRDRIDAYANIEMTHSVLYKKKQLEGKTYRDVVVDFDWNNYQVRYSTSKDNRAPINILSGTFDPLSAFYFVRLFNLQNRSALQRPITDGKKCVIGRANIIKKETIKVSSGTYDTYLIEPELKHVGGVFEKSKNAKIQVWITADHRRIPVKIKSEVVVGSFTGELVSAIGLK